MAKRTGLYPGTFDPITNGHHRHHRARGEARRSSRHRRCDQRRQRAAVHARRTRRDGAPRDGPRSRRTTGIEITVEPFDKLLDALRRGSRRAGHHPRSARGIGLRIRIPDGRHEPAAEPRHRDGVPDGGCASIRRSPRGWSRKSPRSAATFRSSPRRIWRRALREKFAAHGVKFSPRNGRRSWRCGAQRPQQGEDLRRELRVSDFDFSLPEELIALRPASPRDSARLLIVREGATTFEEASGARSAVVSGARRRVRVQRHARDPGAAQRRAAVRGARAREAIVEVTLHKRESADIWAAFAKPGRKLAVGDVVSISAQALCRDRRGEARGRRGRAAIRSRAARRLDQAIAAVGRDAACRPTSPARRATDERDAADYQTIYAARDGAVAAPTAGLHFTPELLVGARCARRAAGARDACMSGRGRFCR